MRLITCQHDGRALLGSWIDNDKRLVDLQKAASVTARHDPTAFSSMLAMIEAGEPAWRAARELTADQPAEAVIDTASVRLLAPLPRPPQIRDFLCFEEHLRNVIKSVITFMVRDAPDPEAKRREIEESGTAVIPEVWYRKPLYYTANRFGIAAPDEDIVRPAYCNLFDFELEFAAIIGKEGRNISPGQAMQHIFGYTIYNDWSARDEQNLVMEGRLGPGKGKDFDQGVTLGPCIVTADELTDPYVLGMTARINGEQWSSGNSSAMHHRFEDCIADVTRSLTIYPGEVIGSGTVGTGSGMEHLRFLKDGDVVELEVSGIGKLRNRVVGPSGH
jgi:2-keto-4-pentenoate hydratase/2-oxohepta-3-ene-1,7-dioic acid hydratase in catechol pathway